MGALVRNAKQEAAVQQEEAQFLTFMLGSEMFAINIHGIKEIIEYGSLTGVPMMPTFIRGVINLRGAVVPVVDLSARFNRAPTQVTRRSCIVIIEAQSEEEKHDIGLVVDAVSEVLEIPAAEIEPAPSFGAKIRADFISGMGKVSEQFVIILDTNKVLSIEELSLLGNSKETSQSLLAENS